MENEKKDRKFWAVFIAILFGFLTLIFWLLYLALGAEYVPSISTLPMIGDFSLDLPFEISRGWDIPALAFIVYIFVLQKKDNENLFVFFTIFLSIIILIFNFSYTIFFPLLVAEIFLGMSLGISFTKKELKNIKTIDKTSLKEVTRIIPKNTLIIIWASLGIGVGFFYGFAVGAILALVSTLSIWAFALVIVFGRKNIRLLFQTFFGTLLMISIATAFVSGNVLANFKSTLIAVGICAVSVVALLLLQSKKKEKKVS